MTLACEGSATQPLDATSCGSFDYARRLASLRMTLACEGSATQALDTTSCGSFDCARRLASLRMTLHSVIESGEPLRCAPRGANALSGAGRPSGRRPGIASGSQPFKVASL